MNKLYWVIMFMGVLFVCSSVSANNEATDESSSDDSEEKTVRRSSVKRMLLERRDNFGCDRVIASCGSNGGCCDAHDDCFRRNKCTARSWTHPWGNCFRCNAAVMACIVLKNPGKSSCCTANNCGKPRG